MGKIVQDMWIFTNTGISIFNRVYDPREVNDQRFAMLLSAINSFANHIYKGGISNFEIRNKKYTIVEKNNFLFIGNTEPKIKNKKIIDELEEISNKFFEVYPIDVLKKWNGDLSIFEDFEEYIQDSMKNKLKNFIDMI